MEVYPGFLLPFTPVSNRDRRRIHEEKLNEMLDKEREANLISLGITMLRFTNEMVCFDVDEVISTMLWKINEIKHLRYQL
jgi:very-short-patch-repair endonuclease